MKRWETKLNVISIAILLIGQQCSNEVIQVGNQIVPSDKGINVPGNTFLFTGSVPAKGVVTGVTSFFRNRNPSIFQVWRPVNSTVTNLDPTFRLEYSALVYPRVTDIVDTVPMEDFLMIGNDLCLEVQKGDRLGVFVETVPSSVTYDWAFQPSEVFVHSVSSPTLYPKPGNVVVFDSLYFPFYFSVKAEIDIGDLNHIGQRKPPTCEMALAHRRPMVVTVTASYTEDNTTEAPCREGPPGPEGPSGFNGTDGAPGPPGERGDRGPQGPRGLKGDSGTNGNVGQKGDRGEEGKVGVRGPPGTKGTNGIPGDRGQKGDSGNDGVKGQKGGIGNLGPPGLNGDPGPSGIKGDIGEKGLKGDKGEAGTPTSSAAGVKGEVGQKGAQGPKGVKGNEGARGTPGLQGLIGVKGEQGEPGKHGQPGPPGPPGPPGHNREPDSGASTNGCEDCYHVSKGLIGFIVIWQFGLTAAFIVFCMLYCRKTLMYQNRVSDSSRRTSIDIGEQNDGEFENTVIKTTGKYETNISYEFTSTSKTKTGRQLPPPRPPPPAAHTNSIWLARQRPKQEELKFDSLEDIENDMLAKELRNQIQPRY